MITSHLQAATAVLGAIVLSVTLAWTPGYSDVASSRLRDVNPDPRIVEVYLEAKQAAVELTPGVASKLWTFNGGIPGPMIEGRVGDTLIVHFTNNLPQPTTVHWHGLEVPANMDGSNIAQVPVAANGGTFRYEFVLLTAATYWYHPHLRTNEQVEKGLTGPLVVRERRGDDDDGPNNDWLEEIPEVTLMLDDILLDDGGQLAAFFSDPDAVLDPTLQAARQVNGREGNVLLVNGRQLPTITVRSGVPQRWRLINVSNARFMRLSVPGHKMYRIGGDGGLLERPITLEPIDMIPNPDYMGNHMSSGSMGMADGEMSNIPQYISNPDPERGVMLVSGERADLIFVPRGEPGTEIFVEWHDFPRGRHRTFKMGNGMIGLGHAHDDGKRPVIPLIRLRFAAGDDDGDDTFELPQRLRNIVRIDRSEAVEPPLVVPFGHTMPDVDGNITFFAAMKGMKGLPFDQVTPAEAPDATVGETRIWEIRNMTGGDHPFHAHGFFFQPLETEYRDMDKMANIRIIPFSVLENKDIIRVPKRPGKKGRSMTIVRGIVRFDNTGREGLLEAFGKVPGPGFSGGWVFHCHILEHADNGMMSFLELTKPGP